MPKVDSAQIEKAAQKMYANCIATLGMEAGTEALVAAHQLMIEEMRRRSNLKRKKQS